MNRVEGQQGIPVYPLTHPQKRIWYTEKMYPGIPVNNIGGTATIHGNINLELLERVINEFIKNNHAMRIRILEKDGEVVQYIEEYSYIKLDYFDFSSFADAEKVFEHWVSVQAKKPFELAGSPLFYFALYRISEHKTGYFAGFHHLIMDSWSINVMTKQIYDTYSTLSSTGLIEENSQISYLDYIDREKHYFQSERYEKNKRFWNDKFKSLSQSFICQNTHSLRAERIRFIFGDDKITRLRTFCRENKISLNTYFVSILILCLHKTSGMNDIIIGTPVLNRSGQKEKNTVGMFVSTMPFKVAVNAGQRAGDFFKRVNQELMECYFHQKYPYDFLFKDLEMAAKGYRSLFQVCINYRITKHVNKLNGFDVTSEEFFTGHELNLLLINIKDRDDDGPFEIDFNYRTEAYSEEKIRRMFQNFNHLTNQMMYHPEHKIEELTILEDQEREWLLYGFNNTKMEYPADQTIIELFEAQVERTPEKIAVCLEENFLTYRELDNKANQLAATLLEMGVERETIVGLMVLHSIETLIGILGILKAGGAYLPIDPGYPKESICYMIEDSGIKILLSNVKDCVDFVPAVKIVDLNDEKVYLGYKEMLKGRHHVNDLAYVIYTSGSTGKPKGVMLEHGNLVNYIWWAKKTYLSDEDETFALYSSLSFDLTVTSIFTPLISGNRIVVYKDDKEYEYVLYRIMRENKVSIIKLTPSHLNLLKDLDNGNSSVKKLIVGGEDLKVALAKKVHESFLGNVQIFNEYGPTETAVGCMIYEYNFKGDTAISVPIGKPAGNVQIYLLDEGMNPVPKGDTGEVYISGDGVARGYLNKPQLTKERFMDNPFVEGGRMYKTGDLAFFLEDGNIIYAGRCDRQVKIRGHRVELGEIEDRIYRFGGVKNVVVLERKLHLENKCICAYIVPDKELQPEALKQFLAHSLPGFMVPGFFFFIQQIPLTSNGKVHESLLPYPKEQDFIGYAAPRNEMEKQLVSALNTLFYQESIGIKDDFFKLGGDSIKAIQLASKLMEKGLKIGVKNILDNPIIENMAVHIDVDENSIPKSHALCEGALDFTPTISWFFAQNFAHSNFWNQSVLLTMDNEIGLDWLNPVMNCLIRHHDSLRLNYNLQTGQLFYNPIHLEKEYKVMEYDLSSLLYSEQCMKLKDISEEFKSFKDMNSDLLFKACIFNLGKSGKRLLLTAHHLLVDGISWRILIEDMTHLLRQIKNGQPPVISSKSHSMQKWSEKLRYYSKADALEEVEYWKEICEKKFVFPTDSISRNHSLKNSSSITCQLNEEETQRLIVKANTAYGTNAEELLVAALAMAVGEASDSGHIILELEGHGREMQLFEGLDISRTVGWFTSIYPVSINVDFVSDTGTQIKSVKEQLRQVPNKGICFGILKYLAGALDYREGKSIRFNFIGEIDSTVKGGVFKLAEEDCGAEVHPANHMTSLIDIIALVKHNRLHMNLNFNHDKFTEATMGGFLDKFMNCIKTVVAHCCSMDYTEFTPSDFDAANISQEDLDRLF